MAEKYIYHVTTTTGHVRKSPRSEISADTTALLRPWVEDMIKGELRGIMDTHYSCRCEQHSSKMIEFVISRLSDDFKQTDLVRFIVCNHSRRKKVAWAWVGGVGDAPEVPFCAAQLLNDNVIPEDLGYIPVFGDFERCIAWTWLEMMQSKKESK
ncbi:lactate dehydrogenase [Aggregatibacter sp.]